MEGINIVCGPNLSGRSVFLKSLTGYGINGTKGVYISENPRNMITALNKTVLEELRFHDRSKSLNLPLMQDYITSIGYGMLLERNPFELSGGEQAVLAILCGSLLGSSTLAIDTLTEQLSGSWRQSTFHLLEQLENTAVLLSDNRFCEYAYQERWGKICPPALQDISGQIANLPRRLDASAAFPIESVGPKSIRVIDLSFSYGTKALFEGVNLDLDPGNIYHLSGGNGSGKSTFSKLLSGILRPSAGRFEIDGTVANLYKRPGRFVGYCFQNPDDQLFEKSVRDEVFHGIAENVKQFITQAFALGPLMNFHPFDLPYLIRKRVALAATLANPRPWYILDEPTLGMDEINVENLTVIIERMASCGVGFLLTSHSAKFLEGFKMVKKLTIVNRKIKVG